MLFDKVLGGVNQAQHLHDTNYSADVSQMGMQSGQEVNRNRACGFLSVRSELRQDWVSLVRDSTASSIAIAQWDRLKERTMKLYSGDSDPCAQAQDDLTQIVASLSPPFTGKPYSAWKSVFSRAMYLRMRIIELQKGGSADDTAMTLIKRDWFEANVVRGANHRPIQSSVEQLIKRCNEENVSFEAKYRALYMALPERIERSCTGLRRI